MSMVLTRSPLTAIGMNGAGAAAPKRRSARLSADGNENQDEPPSKKARVNAAVTSEDGAVKKKGRKKVYDQDDDGFMFSKSKRGKPSKEPAVRNSSSDKLAPAAEPVASSSRAMKAKAPEAAPTPAQAEEAAPPKTAKVKTRRKFPTTPEQDAATKTIRRSKRLSNEHEPSSPTRPAHTKSHRKHDRSPSPEFRPVTVKKKRQKQDGAAEEEEKTTLIALPFADTPIIKRNKEMRKASADTNRRSSSGMRGKRASSLIDEGRGNALPHAEVPTAEFFKHISADLTEPRRMRCLLGWCGSRALPPKPDAPQSKSKEANAEFQALQAARVIQEELSSDLVSKGTLSDWFSRDDEPQAQASLVKKPNPRNVANAAKAEELERELERLKKERKEWETLMSSAVPKPAANPSDDKTSNTNADPGALSPLHSDLLSSPDRAIFAQLNQSSTAPEDIEQRLQHISTNLEFSIDQFADGVHAMATTRDMAERVADKSLKDAAEVLEDRSKERREKSGSVAPMEALRGLARVLNRGR